MLKTILILSLISQLDSDSYKERANAQFLLENHISATDSFVFIESTLKSTPLSAEKRERLMVLLYKSEAEALFKEARIAELEAKSFIPQAQYVPCLKWALNYEDYNRDKRFLSGEDLDKIMVYFLSRQMCDNQLKVYITKYWLRKHITVRTYTTNLPFFLSELEAGRRSQLEHHGVYGLFPRPRVFGNLVPLTYVRAMP